MISCFFMCSLINFFNHSLYFLLIALLIFIFSSESLVLAAAPDIFHSHLLFLSQVLPLLINYFPYSIYVIIPGVFLLNLHVLSFIHIISIFYAPVISCFFFFTLPSACYIFLHSFFLKNFVLAAAPDIPHPSFLFLFT